MTRTQLQRRYRIEAVLGWLALVLAIVTAIVPDWIEAISTTDPDAGSGALEWTIVGMLVVAAALLGLLARRDRRRLRASPVI